MSDNWPISEPPPNEEVTCYEWKDEELKFLAKPYAVMPCQPASADPRTLGARAGREILRLAARGRELEAEHAASGNVIRSQQRTAGEMAARIAALEEENRRLRTEILSKNEELHELELEMREEYPE